MNLVLIGYRGTGKSTIGRLLAERVGWSFADADVELETRAGRTIREIFANNGEGAFRDLESSVLRDLSRNERQVLALGGGVVLREVNRELLLQPEQFVVWLQAGAEVLYQRLQGDPTTADRRPALTGLTGPEEIVTLLAIREPMYRACADLIVATDDRSPGAIADEIIAHFPANQT